MWKIGSTDKEQAFSLFELDTTVHYPRLPLGFPAEAAPYTEILLGLTVHDEVRLQGIPSPVLRFVASEIVVRDIQLKATLSAWHLPIPDDRFWLHHVLPRIQTELQQRDKRLTSWATSQTLPPSSGQGIVAGL